jgi:hypothetical protein
VLLFWPWRENHSVVFLVTSWILPCSGCCLLILCKHFQAKKAGAQLKSRIVAEKPVAECAKLIVDLEDQISTIIREERLASCCFMVEFCSNYVNIYIPSFLGRKWLFRKLKWKSQRLFFKTQNFHHKNSHF